MFASLELSTLHIVTVLALLLCLPFQEESFSRSKSGGQRDKFGRRGGRFAGRGREEKFQRDEEDAKLAVSST